MAQVGFKRKLTVILSADTVGYTTIIKESRVGIEANKVNKLLPILAYFSNVKRISVWLKTHIYL